MQWFSLAISTNFLGGILLDLDSFVFGPALLIR